MANIDYMIEICLKETLSKDVCPICYCIKTEFKQYLRWFKVEGYKEPSTLKTIQKEGFICQKHKEELTDLGEKLNNTFEFLLYWDVKLLSKNIKTLKKQAKNLSCKFCEEEKRIEIIGVIEFAKLIQNEKNLKIYLDSDALICKKHLILSLEKIKSGRIATALVDKSLKRLKELLVDFDDYFSSLDHTSDKKHKQDTFTKAIKFY
ncbi:hypothetical protein [Hippea maritima]|uniref:Uncharacterized protein n=1 Tax=Hippea maritima (strain ATCC 700847 / DSM 10411 / MH2) TaxID=760142 RepID=F2LWM8_HIPMA|nr:hypothetical protein [Hippea maritima]AEA34137.1 hypothetical protein Hipma_1175 [Hippea maritima DSM 10411]